MKKTKTIPIKIGTKTETIPAPAPVISGKQTDVKTTGLSGQVKQVMQTTYKAHQKPGTIIQGKIESAYTSSRNNFITTFNEKGAKILEQLFGTDGSYNNTLNHSGQPTESIHYNKAGALLQKTTSTYTDQGAMIEHIVRNADGTLSHKSITSYIDDGQQKENVVYHGHTGKEVLFSRTVYTYDDILVAEVNGIKYHNIFSSIEYDGEGNIKHQYINKFNEQGKQIEQTNEYTDEKMSKYNTRQTQKYNEHGDCISHNFYNADGSIKNAFTYQYKYNQQNQCIENTLYGHGGIDAIHTHQYNASGQRIETTYRNGDGSLRGVTVFKYDPQGKRIEETHGNADGSIERIHTLFYDQQGKHIETVINNPDGSPFQFAHPKEPGQTEQSENDSHGNWIKKTTFYKKFPVNIILREIIYFGEPAANAPPLIHPLTLTTDTDIEDTSNETEELSDEEAKWIVEAPNSTPDTFSVIRYYTFRYKEPPSLVAYTGPYIEALALRNELKENMQAQEIHSYTTVWNGGAERLVRYSLIFPGSYGYLLHATAISEHDETEFVVPDSIAKHTGHDECIHTSQFHLLRPSHASGKRDWYFEDRLREYIDRCSLDKKPDKPVINMIEVKGNAFSMQEHAVYDDFEIKDLDVNYGSGFEKFHNELMQRFNTSTKGLVLFHGEPGTGKTYYIRHLLRKMVSRKKVVIYMPPNMVDHLVEPGFMTFLAGEVKDWSNDGNFCVLLIEDAEPLLAKRQEGVRIQGVTNLLNMSDGLLNDMLNLQIICTFNVDLRKLDSALLRPGRLIARKEFKPLGELDANILASRLGIKHHFTSSATLGEIYAMQKNKNTLIHDVEPDKGSSTTIDDLI